MAGRAGGDISPRYLCLILTTKQAARTLITHKDLSSEQLLAIKHIRSRNNAENFLDANIAIYWMDHVFFGLNNFQFVLVGSQVRRSRGSFASKCLSVISIRWV